MTEITFSFLWEQGIKKAAEDVFDKILKKQKSIKKYNIKMDLSENIQNIIFEEYDKIRLNVRKKYFDTGEEDENRIDIHKICACITGALLKVKIISIDTTIDTICENENTILQDIAYANYAIAFLSSVYVMYLFILSNFEKNGNIEYYEELEKQSTFIFPKTNPGHDPYVKGRIKTLALNDIYENDFDVLMYADMLFWIEIYNTNHIQQIIEKRNNKKQAE